MQKIRRALGIILCITGMLSYAQEIDKAYVYKQIDLYLDYDKKGEYNKALTYTNHLIDLLERTKQLPEMLDLIYFYQATTEISVGKFDEAIKHTHKALALSENKRDSIMISKNLNLLGVCYYYLSEYDSTQIYYERAYQLKKKIKTSKSDLAVTSYNLALAYEDLENPEKALAYYLESEKYLLEDLNYPNFLADVYVGIAHFYYNERDVERAVKYSEKAMSEGLKSYGADNPNMTFVYTSYANILRNKKDYKTLIDLLHKNLKIRKKSYGENHKWTCESYYKLAEAYYLDGQNDTAEFYYKKALESGKNGDPQYYANALEFAATYLIDQKIKPELAKERLLKALEIQKSIFGEKNEQVASLYFNLANNALNAKNEHDFFNYTDAVYRSCNYDPADLYKLVSPFQVISAIELKSKWFIKQFEKTGDLAPLKEAFNLIDKQTDLLHFAQKNFSGEASKIYFANNYRESIETSLSVCWKLYDKTGDLRYLSKGFDLSEANRNAVLLSGLKVSRLQQTSHIPAEWLEKETTLKKQLSKARMDLHYEKISAKPDTALMETLLDKRIILSRKLDSLQEKLAQAFPEYYLVKTSVNTLDLKSIQQNLRPEEQLISYFMGDDALYVFQLTDTKTGFYCETEIDTIIGEVKRLKNQIINRENTDKTSQKLYALLLKNRLFPKKENLVIVPDNILNYIPFEVLQDEEGTRILNRFKVSYSGSANLYNEMQKPYLNYKLPQYWVGFTPEYTDNLKLNAATDEGMAISKLFNGTLYSGKDASSENFLNSCGHYQITHLAMHAEVDNQNPAFNKLVFADRDLTYSEINVNKIKTNLLVLSACNTGFGKLEKGEGVMSLSRAFHFSGVPAIVMSLWKVPDKETARIMTLFYSFLKEGYSKSEALQKAKLKYIATTDDAALKHPFYWSGFVLSGNPKAIVTKKIPGYLYGVTGFMLMILALFLWKKRKKNG